MDIICYIDDTELKLLKLFAIDFFYLTCAQCISDLKSDVRRRRPWNNVILNSVIIYLKVKFVKFLSKFITIRGLKFSVNEYDQTANFFITSIQINHKFVENFCRMFRFRIKYLKQKVIYQKCPNKH